MGAETIQPEVGEMLLASAPREIQTTTNDALKQKYLLAINGVINLKRGDPRLSLEKSNKTATRLNQIHQRVNTFFAAVASPSLPLEETLLNGASVFTSDEIYNLSDKAVEELLKERVAGHITQKTLDQARVIYERVILEQRPDMVNGNSLARVILAADMFAEMQQGIRKHFTRVALPEHPNFQALDEFDRRVHEEWDAQYDSVLNESLLTKSLRRRVPAMFEGNEINAQKALIEHPYHPEFSRMVRVFREMVHGIGGRWREDRRSDDMGLPDDVSGDRRRPGYYTLSGERPVAMDIIKPKSEVEKAIVDMYGLSPEVANKMGRTVLTEGSLTDPVEVLAVERVHSYIHATGTQVKQNERLSDVTSQVMRINWFDKSQELHTSFVYQVGKTRGGHSGEVSMADFESLLAYGEQNNAFGNNRLVQKVVHGSEFQQSFPGFTMPNFKAVESVTITRAILPQSLFEA